MAGRTVRRLAGNGSGQSLVDIVTSMKHSLSGSLIAKTICKATTEEMSAPKRKHLNILYNCTYEPRLSMPDFANYIIGRSHNSSWVVSFKALITIHHLMNYGSERFSQYLASNNYQLSAPRSYEKNNSQANTMFSFIRHYARYLDARASSYYEVAFDFCRIKRKSEDVNMRTMPLPKLNKVLGPLERQIDALLAFDASSNELMNGVILAAYYLLYKDLIRLYAVYNEAMINIIEHFFTMSKKDCQEALLTYKACVKRMTHVNSFVKVAEACEFLQVQDGFGKQSLIFKPVPTSILETLEQHLAYLEGRKLNNGCPPSSARPTNDAFGIVATNFSNEQKQRIIEEERQRLEQYITQARSDTLRTPSSPIGRSNSEGDLLELFGTASSLDSSPLPFGTSGVDNAARHTANSTTPNFFTDFDELFLQPSQQQQPSLNSYAMKSSCSQFALSSTTASSTPANPLLQPRPLSQFLSQPTPSPLLSSTNPFVNAQYNPSSTALNPQADLDNRLAQIANNLAIANNPTVTSVNWAAATGTRPANVATGQLALTSIPAQAQLQRTTQSTLMTQSSNPWSNASIPLTGGQQPAYIPYNPQLMRSQAAPFPTVFTNQPHLSQQPGNSLNPFL